MVGESSRQSGRIDELSEELSHRQSEIQHLQVLVSSLQAEKKQAKQKMSDTLTKHEREMESLHQLNE